MSGAGTNGRFADLQPILVAYIQLLEETRDHEELRGFVMRHQAQCPLLAGEIEEITDLIYELRVNGRP